MCGIDGAELLALPGTDGNSRMHLTLTMGPQFGIKSASADAATVLLERPQPLLLIGTQVYGLRETPFFSKDGDTSSGTACPKPKPGQPMACDYWFLAPTTDVRNAQRFIVRDLIWSDVRFTGKVRFLPSFSALAKAPWSKSTKNAPPDDPKAHTDPAVPPAGGGAKPPEKKGIQAQGTTPPEPLEFTISGFDLRNARTCKAGETLPPYQLCVSTVPAGEFTVQSDYTANLKLSATWKEVSGVRLLLSDPPGQVIDWNRRATWDFKVAKEDEVKPIATIQVHVGDSSQISFSSTLVNLAGVTAVTFEGAPLPFSYDPTKKVLMVHLTTTITKRAGHKDLTGTGPTLKTPVQLPIDVL
jgi:hypothetical protein